MKGKSKCKILKEIRKQIAKENDIEFVTSECKFRGDCTGTCPKCEAELRYLEEELAKRKKAGKKLAVAGVAAAMMVSGSGCSPEDLFASKATTGDMVTPSSEPPTVESEAAGLLMPSESSEEISEWVTDGEMPYEDSSDSESSDTESSGEASEETSEPELMGDMPA